MYYYYCCSLGALCRLGLRALLPAHTSRRGAPALLELRGGSLPAGQVLADQVSAEGEPGDLWLHANPAVRRLGEGECADPSAIYSNQPSNMTVLHHRSA